MSFLSGFSHAFAAIALLIATNAHAAGIQTHHQTRTPPGDIAGERIDSPIARHETTAQIVARATHGFDLLRAEAQPSAATLEKAGAATAPSPTALVTAVSFDAFTAADTSSITPNPSISVGPSQIIAAMNGRIRSFTKNGVADGVLNVTTNTFFISAMTFVSNTSTRWLNVRYDRFTARWFISAVEVPCSEVACPTPPHRWMVAVSDAASNGVISANTVWSFFFFAADSSSSRCADASLGVDRHALYVGCNMLDSAGNFQGTNGYVIQKASILGAGPMVLTRFAGLAGATTGGPLAPRGVDNHDANATEGYFIGVDNAVFSQLTLRRVSNPGSTTPTISANIAVTVATTTLPSRVDHAGNTGSLSGQLYNKDERLHAAMIRNGRLWTAHTFLVNASGVASGATQARNGVRWYELLNLGTTPGVFQAGTVHDNATTAAAARQYFAPSIAVNGQGHALLGFTMAGTPVGATPAYASRLAVTSFGTMDGPPTVAATAFGTTTANYNPPGDSGGSDGRRWGIVSSTTVDPIDDMTMYTLQQYNHALNSFALRVAQVRAPAPPSLNCAATPVNFSGPNGNVVLTANSVNGRRFYDPGADLPAPALAFARLRATVSNAVVNSVTVNSATQLTLNITAQANGPQAVVVTNPDGQSIDVAGCIVVSGVTPSFAVTTSVAPASGGSLTCVPNPVSQGNSTTCTATPAAGFSVFRWTSSCGGAASGAGNASNFTTDAINAQCAVSVRFATPALNADNSDAPTTYDAATDGVLLLRYLLGYRGVALVENARGAGGNLRDFAQIETHLSSSIALLDVDGDGNTWAHTDGVMILRRMMNPAASTSDSSAMSAITAGAKRGGRSDVEIVDAIDALKP